MSRFSHNAPAAIEWLCRAFGLTKRLVVPGPGGAVVHSELSLGPGVIMVSSTKPAGAVMVQELKDEEYGSRGYMAKDLEGHLWYFGTYRPGAHWTLASDGHGGQGGV